MAWYDRIDEIARTVAVFSPRVTNVTLPDVTDWQGSILAGAYASGNASVASLWKTQPHLRTVVSFRARNIAQLGLHVYRREADGSRVRDRDNTAASALWWADGDATTYDLLFALSGDLDLYDRAYLLLFADPDAPKGWGLRRLPPSWVLENRHGTGRVKNYTVTLDGQTIDLPRESVIRFRGFDPGASDGASPTIESLQDTLREQVESARYRQQVWKRGGRVSSVLSRPTDAPRWTDTARDAFRADWYAKFTGNGAGAGGTPILEDGMTLNRIDFSATDQQFVENAKLSMATVAAAFHVEPTMIGQGDGATYSNIRAFRKMLYTETLGPTLKQIQDRLNKSLLPALGLDPAVYYIEFNLEAKLAGDFEESAAVLSTSVGAPWLTRNEARARQNLPAIEGGDQLVVPLNVLVGGQASPTDAGTQNVVPGTLDRAENAGPKPSNRRGTRGGKSRKAPRPQSADGVTPDTATVVGDELAAFFVRQGKSVLSAVGVGSPEFWDEDRWNEELGAELYKALVGLSAESARAALAEHGLDPDFYNVDQTLAYLQECAASRAEAINTKTREKVQHRLDNDEDPAEVFDPEVTKARGLKAAVSVVAFASSWGQMEAAEQATFEGGPLEGGEVKKRWVVTSSDPRSSHKHLDGETVALEDRFSNGLKCPGAKGDPAEVANCRCELELVWPD